MMLLLFVPVAILWLQEAEKAKDNLDGKKALGKKIIVDWAKQDQGAARNVSVCI